jgi:hypothetical protein
MNGIVLVLLTAALGFAEDGKLIFQKTFPGSTPPWVKIVLERDGRVVYSEAPDDNQPLNIKLTESETAAMFGLAEKLGWFTRTIESGLPVAKMGDKTFRYEAGGKAQEQKFNYSTDLDAQALADWFERISESERYLLELERSARFDKLGVHRVILQIQIAFEKKRLVAVDQYLKWLDRVTKNESYLNIARERASRLAEVFRSQAAGEAAKR